MQSGSTFAMTMSSNLTPLSIDICHHCLCQRRCRQRCLSNPFLRRPQACEGSRNCPRPSLENMGGRNWSYILPTTIFSIRVAKGVPLSGGQCIRLQQPLHDRLHGSLRLVWQRRGSYPCQPWYGTEKSSRLFISHSYFHRRHDNKPWIDSSESDPATYAESVC